MQSCGVEGCNPRGVQGQRPGSVPWAGSQGLAAHYGISGVDGEQFRKVWLTSEANRGGVLGHASVLTVTSNGVETSPVARGVWVLETLLGRPPPPPPPDVKALEPDLRGATTIREQLAKHRDVPACNECHRKIDPYGFAFENYDPIGKWRPTYAEGRAIETAGETSAGRPFAGPAALKRLLLAQKGQFASTLAEKMMAYAAGRAMTPGDRPAIAAVTAALAARGDGFRDLVELVVVSPVFRNK